jgi:hypothetical protein
MSTYLTHRRAVVADVVATNAEAHEVCIALVEAVAQQAVETARAAVAAAEATAAAAASLREVDLDDRDGARPWGPHRHRNISPSPVRHWGHHHRCGSPPIIQHIIKESDGSTPWLMLTKLNYNGWSLLMKVKLQARQLWDAVEFGDVEFHEDRLALDALLASVLSEMVASLADKATTKDAWDSIAATRVSLDRAWKATIQKLRQEWDRLAFRPGEDIDDFALHLFGLV